MSTFFYCFAQGFSNLKKNFLFTLASIITISACVLLFGIFYCLIENVRFLTYRTESTIGITVFFNEGTSEEEKKAFEDAVLSHGGVREIKYISSEEAWENFKSEYFGDQAEELAIAFADDNPLAQSDNYEIFLENIEDQDAEVQYLLSFDIVREVNYANSVVSALRDLNRILQIISLVLIGVLFVISIFLISNTINMTAEMRRRENEIMRLIGATNGMIRAPFVIEGTIIGSIGAFIPLVLLIYFYTRILATYRTYLEQSTGLALFSDMVELVPIHEILPALLLAGLLLGTASGFFVSFFTVRKHLKV